jgi:hypothetical protein
VQQLLPILDNGSSVILLSSLAAHAPVESQHGGKPTFAQAVPVHEVHAQEIVWDGVVHVFDLADDPYANRAYAWSYERDDGKRRLRLGQAVP